MNLAKIIPLAFVMIAGPQILSAIFLATSANWRRNSAAFVVGAALSVTTITTLAFLLCTQAKDDGASGNALDIFFIVLLLAAGTHTFLTRKTAKPPKWMGELENAQPKRAFRLGFLLLGIFPTDILTAIAVGGSVARNGDSWWSLLPFIALTLLFVGSPALLLLIMGKKGEELLPKVRDWMNTNSWIVSEAVIGLFVVITLSGMSG